MMTRICSARRIISIVRTLSFKQLSPTLLQQLHQFRNLLLALFQIIARDGSGKAIAGVVFEEFGFDFFEGCGHGFGLGDDVDAIAVLVNHAREAAHLAFDAGEAFGNITAASFTVGHSLLKSELI